MCFHFGPYGVNTPYRESIRAWPLILRKQNQPPRNWPFYIPCASTGFDARPWYKIGWVENKGQDAGPNARPYNTGMTPNLFGVLLQELKQYIDTHARLTGRMLTVYAWNEWGEGGIIEPSVFYKYAYLDQIKRVFGLHPVLPEPVLSKSRATFIKEQVPKKMAAGETANVTITLKNRGSTTWTERDGFALAYVSLSGGEELPESSPWGPGRIPLGSNEQIAPGQQKTFAFSIKSPRVAGKYPFEWRMVEKHNQPFGDFVFHEDIAVRPTPVAAPASSRLKQ